MTCRACGQPVPPDARFCPACGASVTAEAADRRLVTVLFSDLVGSTSLAERLDPEVLAAVVGAYHDLARAVIERNGGTIAAFQGDGAIGVFGLPSAHEDDAVRAARAGLALVAALPDLEEATMRGIVLEARVGIEAGEVLGDLAKVTNGTLSSDVFNTAARLQAAAKPGTVIAGETAVHLLRANARLRPLPAQGLKGKAGTVITAQVLDIEPGGPRRSSSPFVGRTRQIGWLDRALGEAVTDGCPMLATLIGDAGVGKSRLLDAFAAAGTATGTILRATVRASGEGTTFEAISDLVRSAVGAGPNDEVAAQIGRSLEGRADAEALGAALRSILGFGGDTITDIAWTFRGFLEALAAHDPVVVVLDDVHWAHPALLDLIEDTARWARGTGVFVGGARPDLLDVRPWWAGGLPRALTLTVGPLDSDAARELAESLLGESDGADRVVETAEGNPFFLEQLAAEALELEDRWDPTAAPTTIRALLEARLDRSAPEVGRVLGVASVQGSTFRLDVVQQLVPEFPVDDAMRLADHARLAGTVDQEVGAFTHALVRETIYRRLPKATRAELHVAIADLLPAEGDEQAGAHLERAASLRAELGRRDTEVERRAGEHLARTGAGAFARLDLTTSSDQLGRAASLLPAGSATRLQLLPDLAVAWMEVGRADDAETLLAGAVEEAERSDARRDAIRIRLQQIALDVFTQASEPTIRDHIAESRRLVQELAAEHDDVGLAQGWIVIEYLHWLVGELRLAFEASGRALDHAVRANRLRERVQASGDQAMSLLWGPSTVAQIRAIAGERRRSADPLVAVGGEVAWGVAAGLAGDRDEYLASEIRWRRHVETHGLEWTGAYLAGTGVVLALIEMDRPEEAEAVARESLDTMQRLGDLWLQNSGSWYLPLALARQDRLDEAAVVADALDARYIRIEAMGSVIRGVALSLARAGRGRIDEALALATEAADGARRMDSNLARSLAFEHLAHVLRTAEADGAGELLAEAHARQTRGHNVVGARRTERTMREWAVG